MMISANDIEGRTARAIRTAADAARALGLQVSEPRALYDAFSVIVHLAPSPVVARVPTVLPQERSDPADVAEQQRLELDVAGWLSDQGHAVVPPSPLVPREPVQRDGFSMTFWQLVDQDRSIEPDFVRNAARTADLHAALRRFPRELPFLSAIGPGIPQVIDRLKQHPDILDSADLDRAQREWELLEPVIDSRAAFEAAFPRTALQPVHGDAPLYNVIETRGGPLFSDFELTCIGPVEWDLRLAGTEAVQRYDEAASRHEMHPVDPRVLRAMEAAGMLQAVAAVALVPQLPMLAEGLKPLLDLWRGNPLDGLPL